MFSLKLARLAFSCEKPASPLGIVRPASSHAKPVIFLSNVRLASNNVRLAS